MKIKEQTRKLATGYSKHSFDIADKVDAVWKGFRRVLTVVNFLWIEVVLEEALFCQAFILGSRSTVVVVGVN